MSALNVFNANLLKFMDVSVVTSNSGGTSQGNPNAGADPTDQIPMYDPESPAVCYFFNFVCPAMFVVFGVRRLIVQD